WVELGGVAGEAVVGGGERLRSFTRGEALFGSHGQRDQFGGVAFREVAMKVSQVTRIADRDNPFRVAAQVEALRMEPFFLHHLEVELFRLFTISVLRLPVDLLRNLEDDEQADGETDSPDGRDLLGEKIDHRGTEQNRERECQSERKILSARAE